MQAPTSTPVPADSSTASSEPQLSTPEPRSRGNRWNGGRVMRIVRRVHMYLGLFLVPWLLLFGLSGILFNHPNIGEQVKGTPVPPPRLQELTGFTGWSAAELAQHIAETLNEQKSLGYVVDSATPPSFQGPVLLTANSKTGRHTALVDVGRGRAFVISRTARPEPADVPFKQRLEVPGISTAEVASKVANLLPSLNLEANGPLVPNPRIAPELRFVMRDGSGTHYNVTFDTGTSELAGRVADSWSPLGVSQFLGMLHMTHHFPPQLGVRWAWAFFQDLLGLAMALWSLTGLVMWWQLKATRIAGSLSIAFALGLAAWIMWGTAAELMFGEVTQTLGPG